MFRDPRSLGYDQASADVRAAEARGAGGEPGRPPSFNSGNAFCTVKSAPFTLTSNILSK